MTGQRRPPRFGPETWDEVNGEAWSLWDLWCCVIAELDHHGDLDALADTFVAALRSHQLSDRDANEAKLSHLRDLTSRLRSAGLRPGELATPELLADQRVVARARDKVGGRVSLEWRARTPAMIDTPRRRLRHRSRYGHWAEFPVDPTPFFEQFAPLLGNERFITKGRSFRAANALDAELGALDDARRSPAERLAVHRAFQTAGLELADISDDSYGAIGEARTEAWLAYLSIDWRSSGIAPETYWQDLCELAVWEPYAMDHGHESDWFTYAEPGEVDLIEGILVDLESELGDCVLDHEATAALESLADLYIATGTTDRFVDLAARLPGISWQRVDAMARSQLDHDDRDGAVATYRAAIQADPAHDHLRNRCRAVTGIDPG